MRRTIFNLICRILGFEPTDYEKKTDISIDFILKDSKIIKKLNQIETKAKQVQKELDKVNAFTK